MEALRTSSIIDDSEEITTTSNETYFLPPYSGSISPAGIALGVFMFTVIVVSFTANLFVIVTFIYEKKLRNSFTTLVVNLAVTDLLINVIAMDFYTVNLIFNYWPFGKVLCGIWVFFDYTTVFSSSWSLAAIAIDRYWSIRWSIAYRKMSGLKKSGIIISIVWCSVAAIVWYPIISDRILRTKEYDCVYEPSENPEFVIVLAIFGHHTPCFIIVTMTTLVYYEIKKLAAVRPGNKHSESSAANPNNVATVSKNIEVLENMSTTVSSGDDDNNSNSTSNGKVTSSSDDQFTPGCFANCKKSGRSIIPNNRAMGGSHSKKQNMSSNKMEKDKKAFVTLAHIVICYVLTWVPFHIIYDLSIVNPDSAAVQEAFKYLFWLTYVNSAINPFLYAFTSPELRSTIVKLLRCGRG